MKNESEEIEMLNNLDLMIIVFMVLAAAGLLALVLMFLSKNEKLNRVCTYIVAVLGLYASSIGVSIGWPYFMGQAVAGIALGAVAVAAIVFAAIAKDNVKKYKAARILAAVSLVLGMANGILV